LYSRLNTGFSRTMLLRARICESKMIYCACNYPIYLRWNRYTRTRQQTNAFVVSINISTWQRTTELLCGNRFFVSELQADLCISNGMHYTRGTEFLHCQPHQTAAELQVFVIHLCLIHGHYWHNETRNLAPYLVGPEFDVVDLASNRHEYQRYLLGGKNGRCVGLTTLSPSCADCLEILGASTSWSPKGLSRPVMG
jgi:hypothetical protein